MNEDIYTYDKLCEYKAEINHYYDDDNNYMESNKSYKIQFTNFAGNLGNELIKKIYACAYKLEATIVTVTKGKYNKFAIVRLECEEGCICWDYTVSL